MDDFIEALDRYVNAKIALVKPLNSYLAAMEDKRRRERAEGAKQELLRALDNYTDERIMNALRSVLDYNGDRMPARRPDPLDTNPIDNPPRNS